MTFKVKDGLSVGANTILDASGNLTVPGKTTLSNTTTAGASLNLGTGTADPTTPATGDVWNNTGVLKIRQAAATKTVAYLDSTITGNAANVTGTVAIANGGTNGSATPTAGAVPYGTGTAFGFTAAGTSGQYLTSAGTGVPVWVTLPTTIANATNVGITNDVATATAQYVHFGAATSGNDPVKVSSTRLTFVPSTGNLTTIGSVTVGGNGVVFGGSTSGTTNVKASAIAGTTTITLPATTGTVVTTGDTGTVTSTMITDGTIVNADINASAAIAVSKIATPTISGITLGNNLAALTISTGLTGTSYNGSTAATIALATSGVTAGSYGTATSIPSITVDTYGRITAASGNAITIGTGTLAASTVTAGATNTTVALNFSAAYNANSTTNVTINPVVGPAITALSTVMTGATTGVLSKSGADTYALVTNIATATTLQTARNIQGVSFNGSANITVVTAGTGVNVVGTAVSIGQAVATSSDVRFNSIGVGAAASAVTGTITGLQFTGNSATVTDGVYLSSAQTISGAKTFTSNITISNAAPVIYFHETDQTLPAGRMRLVQDGGAFRFDRNTAAAGDYSTYNADLTISSVGAVTASSFNSITALSSTTPSALGTAAVGTSTTVARADHVHQIQTTVSGNAGTATTLATARNINGVSFNGSADITVTSAAGTLTGTTLNSTVVTSSLTSVGTLGSLSVTGAITGSSFNSITGLSSTAPIVAGTATVGTGTTVARADHVHPVQTNVSGTAGGLSATLAVTSGGTGVTTSTGTGSVVLSSSPAFAGTPTAPTAITTTNTTQLATTEFVQAVVAATASAVKSALFPIGSIYTNSSNATNPSTLLGFGTWSVFGAGRVLVGFDSANTLFDTAEEIGGSADSVVVSHTHTASTALANTTHSHSGGTSSVGDHQHYMFANQDRDFGLNSAPDSAVTFMKSGGGNSQYTLSAYSGGNAGQSLGVTGYNGAHSHTFTTGNNSATPTASTDITSTGVSGANANYQPYITVYMWKRTA